MPGFTIMMEDFTASFLSRVEIETFVVLNERVGYYPLIIFFSSKYHLNVARYGSNSV